MLFSNMAPVRKDKVDGISQPEHQHKIFPELNIKKVMNKNKNYEFQFSARFTII